MIDLLIRNGTVVDPLRKELFLADVGITEGRICFLGLTDSPEANKEIDADGLLISPGFIDTHMHFEQLSVGDPFTVLRALLKQGVTTAIAGHCGVGLFMSEYCEWFKKKPILNLGFMVGSNTLRNAVGLNDRYAPADNEQINSMIPLLRKSLEEGALGLSFGLEYQPGTTFDEMNALARVVREYDQRFISIHIRHDGSKCLEAVKEAIKLAEISKVRVQISHIGSMTAFGYASKALAMIDHANENGIDVTFDVYPYDAFAARIGSAVFDPGFEKRLGKGLEALEISTGLYKGALLTDEIFNKARIEDPQAYVIAHVMRFEEIQECLLHPASAIASDAVLRGNEGHPRAAGTFPRGISILKRSGLDWPEAIAHATIRPAEMIWYEDVGVSVGKTANIVLIDPEGFHDCATFQEPLLPPEGISKVILNGKIVVENNEIVDEYAGKIITAQTKESYAQ